MPSRVNCHCQKLTEHILFFTEVESVLAGAESVQVDKIFYILRWNDISALQAVNMCEISKDSLENGYFHPYEWVREVLLEVVSGYDFFYYRDEQNKDMVRPVLLDCIEDHADEIIEFIHSIDIQLSSMKEVGMSPSEDSPPCVPLLKLDATKPPEFVDVGQKGSTESLANRIFLHPATPYIYLTLMGLALLWVIISAIWTIWKH